GGEGTGGHGGSRDKGAHVTSRGAFFLGRGGGGRGG
ncbi:unnamed protein product, partial [Ixodes persulcatus]